ncbi:hypothetical protein ACJ41O_001817 [Fusarium nematophilum]
MEHSNSHAQDGSEANNSILLPTFNLIIPSRPNTPLQLDASYLESAGLLDESCAQEQSHCDLTWQPDPCFQDHHQPTSTNPQPIWWQDSPPVLRTRESLEQQLTSALCQHAHKESKGFLPLDKLHELVVEDSVAEALTACIPGLSLDAARIHAQEICPRSMRDPLQPSFRRMFAILVMIQQPQEILTFVRHSIADHDLPLVKARNSHRGAHELRRKTQPHKTLECLQGWSPFLVNSFEEYQWTLLSPFFSRGNKGTVRFYPLDDQTILPFVEDSSRDASIEDDEDFQGGHGSISRVKIHPSHYDFHDISETYESESTFAVKRLHSRNREMFSREVDALKRLSGQKHIVPLLATFEYKNSYHLLFPWANANLRRYWAMFPNPSADKRYGLWVAKQCKGMAEGLSIIHEPPAEQGDDYAYERVLQPNHSQPQRSGKPAYGRHGDIKPENILWFRNGPNTDIGVLEIADFGLTRFHHRQSRSNISPVGMGNSPTYRAPEFDMPDGLLSRSYDVWALGCLYLEFITWYFLGWNGVTQFSASRETKRNDLSADDCYFELSSSRDTGNICSKVKPAVIRWMAFLRQHWACSPFFHDFLDLVESSMLVVETNGQRPVRRVTAADVKQRMVRFYNRSGSNAAYLSGGNPLTDIPAPMQQLRRCQTEEARCLGQYAGSAPVGTTDQPGSWELAWSWPDSKTKGMHLSRSSTSDGKDDVASPLVRRHTNPVYLSDVFTSETSASTSDLSNQHVSTTQTAHETGLEPHARRFACPFFKMNPRKHGKTCSRGWEQIHRLKEHLFRKHTLPDHRCTRCLSHFKDNAELEAHVRSVTPCALKESSDSESITPEQERLLRKRPRRETMSHDADCERWRKIFSILFPGTDQGGISPYNEYSLPSSTAVEYSETIADYSKFLNGGIPSHVQSELQATISRELGFSEVDGRKIVDIIPMLQQTLLQSFQNYKGQPVCDPKTSTSAAVSSTSLDSSTATTATVETTTTLFTTTTTASTTATTSAESEVTPLLLNGDFDKTPSVSPWEWAERIDNYPLGIASGVSHEGGHSLRLKFDPSRLDFLVQKLDTSRLVAGQDYDVSAWLQFDKARDADGGCTEVLFWCQYGGFQYAENAGNGRIEPGAGSIGAFGQMQFLGACRWSQAQLDQNPSVMFRFQCERTIVFLDSVEMVPHGQ